MNPPSLSIIETIDSKVDVPVEKDEAVEKAVQQCFETVPHTDALSFDGTYKYFRSLKIPGLTPAQIDLVLQRFLHSLHKKYNIDSAVDLGLFISALIQKSYDTGHNGFVLHTQDILLDGLCAYVQGKKNNRVNILVYGDTNGFTGEHSKWCSVRHEGNTGIEYFSKAKNDEIFISGSVGFGFLSDTKNITFKTTSRETFNHIRDVTKNQYDPLKNNLYLIDSEGKILDRALRIKRR